MAIALLWTILPFAEASAQCVDARLVRGSDQSGPPNSELPGTLVVSSAGAGATNGGVIVRWRVTAGNAVFSSNGENGTTTTLPSGQGLASVHLLLGATPGSVTVTAQASVIVNPSCTSNVLVFRETITTPSVGINGQIAPAAGNNQSGALGTQSPTPLNVQVMDAFGAPIVGQRVDWVVAQGGATLASPTSTTGATGLATNTFNFGSQPGAIVISATTTVNKQVLTTNFNATASAPVAGISGGDGQSALAGSALGQPVSLQVNGPTGGLANVLVTWTVLQGGGSLAAPTTLTDAGGRTSNTWTLGQTPGLNRIQASVVGGGNLVFTANGTGVPAPSASGLTLVSGSGQLLLPGRPSQPLVVKVTGAQGAAVSGANVLWTATGGGGLTSPRVTTDANGLASNVLTVGLPGNYSVTASVEGSTVPPVTFTFNNGVANVSGLTAAQRAVAIAVDRACPALVQASSSLTPAQNDLLGRCSEIVGASGGSNSTQAVGALDALRDDQARAQGTSATNAQIVQSENLRTRLAQLRAGATGIDVRGLAIASGTQTLPLAMLGDSFAKDPAAPDSEAGSSFNRWGFFATGRIGRGNVDGSSANTAFDFDSAGLTAGVDYRFSDAVVAGLALGYSRNNTDVSNNRGKVDSDGYSVSGYFTWYHKDDFYIDGSATIGWVNYDLERSIIYQIANGAGVTTVNQTASASPDGKTTAFSLSIGKDFARGALTISPYLRTNFTHVTLDSYNESLDASAPGAGLGLAVDERTIKSQLGILGARFNYAISKDWGVLIPNALIEFNHEFKNDARTVVSHFINDPTATPIVISDPTQDNNYFNLGLGVSALFPNGRSAYVYYEHITGLSQVHEDRLEIGVRIEF